jgi:osmotically-inducible protein OsmY
MILCDQGFSQNAGFPALSSRCGSRGLSATFAWIAGTVRAGLDERRATMGTSLAWQTDSQLHDAVQRQLDWGSGLNAKEIAVLASEGIITLTGFVNTYAEKLAAEEAVKRVRGVRGLANDIQIKPSDERSDPDIAKDAVHSLQSRPDLPRSVSVTVRDGFLTLEGSVEWNCQRTAAESVVRHVEGVKGVSNAIYIKPVASPS